MARAVAFAWLAWMGGQQDLEGLLAAAADNHLR